MRGRRIAGVLIGALALSLVVGGMASATAPTPGILAGAVHGEGTFSYGDGSERSFVADYGLITAVDAARIEVLRRDGVPVSVALSDDTCVRKDGRPAETSDLTVGMRAVTIAEWQDDGSLVAAAVRAGRPLIRADQPGCGLLDGAVHGDPVVTYTDGSTRPFAWDRGAITAISDTELSLVRRDGVTVTATVDGETRVLGGMTVGDLEVGDRITLVSEGGVARVIRAVCVNRR